MKKHRREKLNRSNVRKEEFIWAHSLRVPPITAGHTSQQELETAGSMASAVRARER